MADIVDIGAAMEGPPPQEVCIVCQRRRGDDDGQCREPGNLDCRYLVGNSGEWPGDTIKRLAVEVEKWADVANQAVDIIADVYKQDVSCGWCLIKLERGAIRQHVINCAENPLQQRLRNLVAAAKNALSLMKFDDDVDCSDGIEFRAAISFAETPVV